jgi:hypothetical protein
VFLYTKGYELMPWESVKTPADLEAYKNGMIVKHNLPIVAAPFRKE